MKKIFLILVFLFPAFFSQAGIPPRTPFIVLNVNGKTYNANAEISVRPGERIRVEALFQGGQRDYCSNPNTYANVGRNTIVETQGNDGMSFSINGGQFRGDWKLTKEEALFSSAAEVKITKLPADGVKNREVEIEVPKSGLGKTFLKVTSKTSWHYVRKTPAGRTDKDENQTATATFYLVLSAEDGVWYSTNNIKAKGMEDFTVRNQLDYVQSFYDQIEKCLKKKDMTCAQRHVNNLKNYIPEVKRAIADAQKKKSDYQCEVTFIGLPTDVSMQNLKKLKLVRDHWKVMYQISQTNVVKINEMLLNRQMTFSNNILKSVFKNYINWGTSIPTGVEDLLSTYDPSNVFGPVDLPRKVLGWWQEADKDASILKNQIKTIAMLSELRNFYLERLSKSVDESKIVHDLINDLSDTEKLDAELKSYFGGVGWATWQHK